MSNFGIIVIGASAGGVEALIQLVRGLPADLNAALFVVLHLPASSPSVLPHILSRQGALRAVHPVSMEPIRSGRIYVAPPNFHLIVDDGSIVLSTGPKENGHRPSIDVLFRSAAINYGARTIGIVLSGTQSDGAAGLKTISAHGGITVVQDPDEALYASMPRHALDNCPVDHVLPIAGISALLPTIVGARPEAEDPGHDCPSAAEVKVALGRETTTPDDEQPGEPSVYACPDCHGTLWEIREGEVLRFRCRVGHAWTAEDLLVRQQDGTEDAMWTAVRALEEKASLARRIGRRLQSRAPERTDDRYEVQAREALWQAELIRRALEGEFRKSQGDLDNRFGPPATGATK